MSEQARCADCGRFVGRDDTAAACDFTPLNEFGPEVIEWVCGKCAEKSGELEIHMAEMLSC